MAVDYTELKNACKLLNGVLDEIGEGDKKIKPVGTSKDDLLAWFAHLVRGTLRAQVLGGRAQLDSAGLK